jgi:hypothetical protein
MYYEYIIEDGVYYVPRPSGVIAGMVRHSAFRSLLGQSPTIASPEFWELNRRKDEESSKELYYRKHCKSNRLW